MSFKQQILGGKRKFLVAAAAVTLLLIVLGIAGSRAEPALESASPAHDVDGQSGSEAMNPSQGFSSGQATGTDVFVNGQELSLDEVYAIEDAFGSAVPAGRYWLDGAGNYGFEGGPAMGNIYGGQTGGNGGGLQSTPFGNVGGGSFYDPQTGCSVMPGGGLSC